LTLKYREAVGQTMNQQSLSYLASLLKFLPEQTASSLREALSQAECPELAYILNLLVAFCLGSRAPENTGPRSDWDDAKERCRARAASMIAIQQGQHHSGQFSRLVMDTLPSPYIGQLCSNMAPVARELETISAFVLGAPCPFLFDAHNWTLQQLAFVQDVLKLGHLAAPDGLPSPHEKASEAMNGTLDHQAGLNTSASLRSSRNILASKGTVPAGLSLPSAKLQKLRPVITNSTPLSGSSSQDSGSRYGSPAPPSAKRTLEKDMDYENGRSRAKKGRLASTPRHNERAAVGTPDTSSDASPRLETPVHLGSAAPASSVATGGRRRNKMSLASDPPALSMEVVDAIAPVRGRIRVALHEHSIRFISPSDGKIEFTIPLEAVKRAFLLYIPADEEEPANWTVVLTSLDSCSSQDLRKPARSQAIFSVDLDTPITKPVLVCDTAALLASYTFPQATFTVHGGGVLERLRNLVGTLPPSITTCTALGDETLRVKAARGNRSGHMWLFGDGILWGAYRPCEYWTAADMASVLIHRDSEVEFSVTIKRRATEEETQITEISMESFTPVANWIGSHQRSAKYLLSYEGFPAKALPAFPAMRPKVKKPHFNPPSPEVQRVR
jgi:hypothetical protein